MKDAYLKPLASLVLLAILFGGCSSKSGEIGVDQLGKKHSIEKLEGKPTVIQFWSSWCSICIKEMDNFGTSYQDAGLGLISINIDLSNAEQVYQFAKDRKYDFPVFSQTASQAFNLAIPNVVPTSYLRQANGKIIGPFVGPKEVDHYLNLAGMKKG